jgi:hypothetical protein
MQKHNYKIIKETENPLEATIEKDNIKAEFTLIERDTKKREVEKKLRELKAQFAMDEASAKNVEENHPHVLEATEDDIKKAHELVLYVKYQEDAKESAESIKIFEDALAEWEEELKEICEQTGIVLYNEEDLI